MARFTGYPFTLRTALSPDECHLRLVDEFYRTGGHATGERRLFGRQEGRGFVIRLREYHLRHDLRAGQLDTSRSCRCTLRPCAGGTLISGRYGYHHADGLLLYLTLGLLAGIVVGALLAIGGAVLAWRVPQALWLAALGLAILGTTVALLLDSHDGGSSRERDAIARYLARVLAAEPVEAADPPGRRDTNTRR